MKTTLRHTHLIVLVSLIASTPLLGLVTGREESTTALSWAIAPSRETTSSTTLPKKPTGQCPPAKQQLSIFKPKINEQKIIKPALCPHNLEIAPKRCIICLDEDNQASMTYCKTCKQPFHTACIERWLSTESVPYPVWDRVQQKWVFITKIFSTCPGCRAKLKE